MSRVFYKRAVMAACAAALLTASGGLFAQAPGWTLGSTAQRVLEVAPEQRAAESEIKARQGARQQAGLWANPTLELGASNAMGKEDGQGGTDLSEMTLRQALPVSGRLSAQRQQAEASLDQAEALAAEQRLELEYEAARVFHRLQLDRALNQLARQRLESAEEFQHSGRRREQAGDLSRLERLRLDLVREHASQLIANSEGKEAEALSDFRTLLNLGEPEPQLAAFDGLPELPDLAMLESRLSQHPALMAAGHEVEAARQGVAVARANRFADPEIWLARGRDYLGSGRQTTTAFGVTVTLPLWDRNSGHIGTAMAQREKAQFQQEALQRQLGNRLRLNHLHLGHLIEQAQEYRAKVLEPAEQIFQLSRSGFAAGEVEILTLVDAVDRYYESRSRYLELLQECWLEAAELRRSAGLSLLAAQSPNNSEGAAQ